MTLWRSLLHREITDEMVKAVEDAALGMNDAPVRLPDGMTLQEFNSAVLLVRGLNRPQPDIKTTLVDEAKRIVTGARRAAYGTPEQNFERIARFWQAYFENTGRADLKITAADVSPMMRLMKEARLAESPDHYDSYVDLVGYTLTGAEVNGVKKPVDTL